MTDKGASRAADKPQGPGWWLASDGRYYPPELSADSRAKKKAKKKATKKPAKKAPVAKKAPTAKKSPAKSSPTPKKATKKKVVATKKPSTKKKTSSVAAKKSAAKKEALAAEAPAPTSAPSHAGVDDTGIGQRAGQQKFTALPPPTDQIAARQIQAKEQGALLSGARQQAALRALTSLGEEEPVLVGAGARSFDARRGAAAPVAPVTPEMLPEPEARVQPADKPSSPGAGGTGPTVPPVTPRAPAQAPALPDEPVEPPDEVAPVTADNAATQKPTIPAPPQSLVPSDARHAPEERPAPSAEPMGTDVPFMEVKGSALATNIDRIGEKILIFADRVELRDRGNSLTQAIRYDQLTSVEVQKKIMGPTLLISCADGEPMSAKALRPELASGAKAMIEKHAKRFRSQNQTDKADATALVGAPITPSSAELAASAVVVEPVGAPAPRSPIPAPAGMAPAPRSPIPAPARMAPAPEPEAVAPPAPDPVATPAPAPHPTHRHVLVGMLEELHAAGILDPDELAAKKSLIERNDRH